MYVQKTLIERVIKLFIENPKMRDDKYATVEYVVNKYYKSHIGKSVKTDFKLYSDIDRAFRYIQQHEKSLRGDNWKKRQKQGGRHLSDTTYFENIVKAQLKLF
jgi:hypothetical protein